MRDSSEKNRELLLKIADHCNRIATILNNHGSNYDDFIGDYEFQQSCCFSVIQIGEYVSRIGADIVAKYSDIPWRAIKANRNIFAHDYDVIDYEQTWNTITRDIPELRTKIMDILNSEFTKAE